MLGSIEPKQFDEWAAAYRIQAWGIELQPEQQSDKPEDSLSTFKSMAGF